MTNEHFVETRMKSGFTACQALLSHKVIHNFCGYRKKAFVTVS
jgi:hypothetical protein